MLIASTFQATRTTISSFILGLRGVYRIGESLAIRVELKNPKK